VAVLHDLRAASGLDDRGLEKVFTAGGGPPAVVGRDADGRLMVPAATLHCLVNGVRASVPGAREVLVNYLVENFGELVYA
jgi:hypothetical protein